MFSTVHSPWSEKKAPPAVPSFLPFPPTCFLQPHEETSSKLDSEQAAELGWNSAAQRLTFWVLRASLFCVLVSIGLTFW